MSESGAFADFQFYFSVVGTVDTAAFAAPPSALTPFADAKAAFDAVLVAGANAKIDSVPDAAPPELTEPELTDYSFEVEAAPAATFQFGNDADWAGATAAVIMPRVPSRSDVAHALQFLIDTNVLPIKELLLAIANYTVPAVVTVSTLVGAPTLRSAPTVPGGGKEWEFMGPGATQCALLGGGKELAFVDSTGHTIQRLNLQTLCVTTIAGFDSGHCDGAALSARFYLPYAIAYNRHDSSLLVADYNGSCLRQISGFNDTGASSGGGTVRTIAGHPTFRGYADATDGAAVRFDGIRSILVSDKQDVDATMGSVATSVYLCEETGGRLRHVSLPAGTTTTLIGGNKDAVAAAHPVKPKAAAQQQFQPFPLSGAAANRILSEPVALAWDLSVRTPDDIKRDGGGADGEVMYIATRERLKHSSLGRVFMLRRYNTATRELSSLPLVGGYSAEPMSLVWFTQHTLLMGTETGVYAVSTRTGRTSRVAGHVCDRGCRDGEPLAEARFNTVSSVCVIVDDATGTERVLAVDRNNRMIRLVQGSIRAHESSQPDIFEYATMTTTATTPAAATTTTAAVHTSATTTNSTAGDSAPANEEQPWAKADLTFNF